MTVATVTVAHGSRCTWYGCRMAQGCSRGRVIVENYAHTCTGAASEGSDGRRYHSWELPERDFVAVEIPMRLPDVRLRLDDLCLTSRQETPMALADYDFGWFPPYLLEHLGVTDHTIDCDYQYNGDCDCGYALLAKTGT